MVRRAEDPAARVDNPDRFIATGHATGEQVGFQNDYRAPTHAHAHAELPIKAAA